MKPHGTLVTYGSNNVDTTPINFRAMLWGSLNIKAFLVYDLQAPDRDSLNAEVKTILESKRLMHKIGAIFRLEEIIQAHEAVEAGTSIGSVQIEM